MSTESVLARLQAAEEQMTEMAEIAIGASGLIQSAQENVLASLATTMGQNRDLLAATHQVARAKQALQECHAALKMAGLNIQDAKNTVRKADL